MKILESEIDAQDCWKGLPARVVAGIIAICCQAIAVGSPVDVCGVFIVA